MKRFLSIILTASMLMSATPAVFAENNAVDESVIVAEELTPENQEEVTENVTKDVSEEISGEGEENSEEQISLMSEENDVSLLANETNEVQYSTDNDSTWKNATLADAVTAIGTGTGTIKVMADIATTSEIVVSGDINLDLCGFTINGNNTHRVFKVTGKLTLNDSSEAKTGTIKGGYIKSSSSTTNPIGGAAVYLPADTNAVFVMNSGNFLENKAEGDLGLGGAILAEPNTTLTINGGSFIGNEAAFAGGAIGVDSAEFLMNGVELSKNKSIEVSGTFYGAYGGGAIYLQITTGYEPKNVPTIKNCIFDSNSTTASQGFGGGAIISNEASLNITGCKFTNNTASAYRGGAIHAYASDVNIIDSIISDNEAKVGGGIYISSGGTTTVSNSYIVDNKATSAGYDVANNSGSAKYTMPTSYTDKSTGKTYGVKWYYDGLKDGTTADRYSESTAEQKTELTETPEKCGLKTVYTELENYTITLTCPEAKRNYIKVYIDGNEATGNTIEVTNQSTVKLVADQTAYDNGFYIWKVGSKSYSYNATNPEKNAGVENYGTVTLTNISKDTTVEAIFRYTVTITANPETAGTVVFKKYDFSSNGYVEDTEAGNKKVFQSKSDVDFYQQPKDGYTFTEWKIYDSGTKEEIKNISVNDYVSSYGVYEIKAPERDITIEAVYQKIPTYTVKVTDPIYMAATYPGGTDSKIGTITVTGAEDLTAVPAGTKLELAIVIENNTYAKNHSFVKWVVKTESGTEVTVTDNKFTMPGEAVTVTAEYVPDIQMTFYAGPSADTTYECKNYTWNGDGTITYTMPGNKGTLTISKPNGFKKWTYMSETTQNPTVTANDVVTVTVNTNEGYTFNGIKSVTSQMGNLNGTFNNSGTYTFSVPVGTFNNYKGTQNAYIILDITTNQYNITKNYNTNEGEVIVIDRFDSTHTSIDKAYYKENLWVSIEPKANYKIKSVSCKVGENNVSDFAQASTTGKSYTFTMPASDVTINVEFELDACAITTDIKNGTISGITSPAAIGSDVSFTLAPTDDTYKFDSYKVFKTGGEATTVDVTESNGTYKFTMPDYPVTVSAVFVKKTHDVTITKDGEGTVAISPETPVEVGQTVNVTATPDEHWELSSLTMNGTDITSAKSFVMPNEAVELKVVFVKQKFSVTASATTNGTIELITESPINWGDNFTINVKADPHYEIDTVIVDGKAVSVNEQGDYTFVMPTHDVIVSATFKKVKYTITGTGDHATFSIPSSDTYNWGDTVEFTVTPDKWYSVKSIYADNETVAITKVDGKENAYSFTMPQGNVIITAVTERPNFTVTFDSKGGSNITPKTVANGDVADKPGVPIWAGRGFAGWYTDEACTQKYDFTAPVTESITLYAHWFLWGDVNNDGTVDSYDALLIRRCRAGLTDYSLIENRLAGFVNGFEIGRNYPDSGDAVSIRRFRAGLINRYKVEDGAAGYEFDLENDTYIPKN